MRPSARILRGDVLDGLRTLPEASVHCCVTSPPYWGLRDYGVEGQIGLESTPEAYVARMVEVFREVRRVLRDDGTLWLNLGDSYAAQRSGTAMPAETLAGGCGGQVVDGRGCRGRGDVEPDGVDGRARRATGSGPKHRDAAAIGLKHKDLVGIPWRVAFALQADGWWLRQDIIWAKPNPMPESVRDRCTKAHEYVFLLTKSERYFYDAEAIKEPSAEPDRNRGDRIGGNKYVEGVKHSDGSTFTGAATRNRRSVWTITTKPYSGAHFAVMPEALVTPCILAGSRASGKRCDCDKVIRTPLGDGESNDPTMHTGRAGMNRVRRDNEGTRPITVREQRGHAEQMRASPHRDRMEAEAGAAFAHYIRTDSSGARPLPLELLNRWTAAGWITPVAPCGHPEGEPDTVLDPFAGSGTTLAVALSLGRSAIGIELNPEYVKLARDRVGRAIDSHGLFLSEASA